MPEYVYHFTSPNHLAEILNAGYLKLTPSNLIEPKDVTFGRDPETGNATMVSAMSDSVKPVVWLTTQDTIPSNQASGHGLNGLKTIIRCKIPMKADYLWWHKWSDDNRMKSSWKKRFIRNTSYSTWYICEHRIPLEDIEDIDNTLTGEIYWPAQASTEE